MLEYATDETWVGTPILAIPEARKAHETDVSWAMRPAAEETEQEMRRRWLKHHLEVQNGRCAYCGSVARSTPLLRSVLTGRSDASG
jgi:hypothetical protein